MRLNQWGMILVICALCFSCGGDQSLEFSETLTIGMIGDFTAPEGVTGNAEPRNVTVTLTDVQIVATEAGTVDLHTDEAAEFKIASRNQILFEADLADYVDDTITEVQVTFSAEATATGKYEDELAFTLAEPIVTHSDSLAVSPAKTIRIDVLLQWLNTITRDEDVDPPTETIEAPKLVTEEAD